ncbi:MAG: hypothetical protein QW633_03035 [Candidatus Aenigmatarchaeota archaeon]
MERASAKGSCWIALVFLFISFSFSQFANLTIRPTQIYECIEANIPSSQCNLLGIQYEDFNSLDSTTYGYLRITNATKGTYGRINVSFSNYPIHNWINVKNIYVQIKSDDCRESGTFCFLLETPLGNDDSDKCYLFVGDNSTKYFSYNVVLPENADSCKNFSSSNLFVQSFKVTQHLDHLNKIKNAALSWKGYDSNDKWVRFVIDYTFIILEYFNLTFSNLSLSSYEIDRGQYANISALFQITDVNHSFLFIKQPSREITLLNKSYAIISNISLYDYWINYTFNSSDPIYKIAGIYNFSIFANNSFGGYNTTFPELNLTLWSFPKVKEVIPYDKYAYVGETVNVDCLVADNTSTEPLPNQPVNFIVDYSVDDNNKTTNGTGYATRPVKITVAKNITVKCRTFGNTSTYYKQNLISSQNESSTWIKFLELTALPKINKTTNIKVKEPIRIFVNVTNASEIKIVNSTITYLKVNSTGSLFVTEYYNLSFSKKYEDDLYEYYLDYIPNSSGNYFVSVMVEANPRTAANTTTFFVDFGKIEINLNFPKNKLLINQSFFSNVSFKAVEGDVWNVNVSLNSSNYSKLFLNSNNFYNQLFNLSNGEIYTIDNFWNLLSIDFGGVLINVTAIPSNGISNSTNFSITIIGFETSISNKSILYGKYIIINASIYKDSNSSFINEVKFTTSFLNITDTNTLSPTTITINMDYLETINDRYIFSLNFTPERSGFYIGFVGLNISSVYSFIKNDTEPFNVSFGNPKISFYIPFYHILTNQTFNITTIAESFDGDIWNVSFNLTIFDQTNLNITKNENFFHERNIAIKNGTKYFENWSAFSNNSGLNRMIVELFSLFKNTSIDETFEVIFPLDMKIENNQTFIDEYSNLIVDVVGNNTISNVNFTILKAFDSGIETFFANRVEVKTVRDCGIEIETGNVASLEKGAFANSLNGNNANLSIDSNNETSWTTFNAIDNINITLRSIFPIRRIEILWFGSSSSYANISYIDENNQVKTFEKNIQIPNSLKTTIFDKFTPFKTYKFIISISNGVALHEFRAFATEPRLGYCYRFSYNFTNFTRSGNYSVFSNIVTLMNNSIIVKNQTFFVKFGIPSITIKADPVMLSGQNQTYYVNITAYKGDLRNLTIRFNSENESYINITESEDSFVKYIDEIFWKGYSSVNWNIKASLLGEPEKSVLTFLNVSSNTSMGNNNSEIFSITIYPFDLEPPTINNFFFEIFSLKTNKSNLNDSLKIIANITDNIFVKEVNASLVFPSGIEKNVTMKRIENDLFAFQFLIDDISTQINETGNYSIRIFATDLNSSFNTVNSDESNFTAFNKYSIEFITPFNVFNKGESIIFVVRDVNSFNVSNSNITILLIDSLGNITNQTNIISENGTAEFFLNPSYTLQSYSLNVTAEKYGNIGNNTLLFLLTNLLKIKVIVPSEGLTMQPKTTIKSAEGLPRAKIFNYREDKEIKDAIVNILCYNINSELVLHNETEFYYNACSNEALNTYSFDGCIDRCYSPNTYGTTFNITINSTDYFNNSGLHVVNLRTIILQQQPAPPPSSSPGVSAPTEIPICKCGREIKKGCGISPCKPYEMYFERLDCNQYCLPNQTYYCSFSPECNITFSIQFKGNETRALIETGTNRTLIATISNNGYTSIKLTIKYLFDCTSCTIYGIKDNLTIELGAGERRDIPFIVHSFLNSTEGEYKLILYAFSDETFDSESIVIEIKENGLINDLKELESKLKDLKKIYEEYKNFGVPITKSIDEMNNVLINAKNSIANNALLDLINYNKKLSEEIKELEEEINKKYWMFLLLSYKYLIIAFSIALFFSTYLIVEVIVPYIKLSKEIISLTSKEKELINARKSAEEQYFKRKISEKAFYDIMVKYQSEILKVRGRIKDLTIIRNNLLREALKAKTFIVFLKKMRIGIKYRKEKV